MDRTVAAGLIRWFEAHRRDLPWRRRRTPWRTWVSEVMLQQTTADVVARRFEPFVRRFPGPSSLASAPVRAVLAEWSGLGLLPQGPAPPRRGAGLRREVRR